jgi:hypothetical protein
MERPIFKAPWDELLKVVGASQSPGVREGDLLVLHRTPGGRVLRINLTRHETEDLEYTSPNVWVTSATCQWGVCAL